MKTERILEGIRVIKRELIWMEARQHVVLKFVREKIARIERLADPYNNLRDYAFIFFLLASLFVMYLLNVPFDKLTEISSWSGLALFLAGCVAFTASLIILSRLTLKAILHLPLKRAIAELGKAVKRNKPLRSIYTKHF